MCGFCRTPAKQTNLNKKGFTLIELVVVIIILGVLYFIAVRPNESDHVDTTTLSASKTIIKGDLKHCRSKAMQTGLAHKLVFTMGENHYDMYYEKPTQNVWLYYKESENLTNDAIIFATTLPNQQIVFRSNGKPYEDPQPDNPNQSYNNDVLVERSITIKTNAGTEKTITIEPETGYIQ